MINVNQFTEQLRMMPDQALQRVAMMYKNDPYILPLVVSEDMARKKLRMAAQAQMAQPQPKVVDQAIMAMGQQPQAAPGLAALRAPNMETMADGGIAGYADGGDMDFVDHNEPVVRYADGGAVQRFQQGGQPRYPGMMQYQGAGDTLLPRTTGYEGMSITEFLSAAYDDVSNAVKKLYNKIPKESLAQVVAEDLEKKKQRTRKNEPLTEPPLLNEYGEPYTPEPTPTKADTGLRDPGEKEPTKKKETRTAADMVRQPAPPTAPVAPPPAPAAPIPTYTAPTPTSTAEGIAALSKAPNEETAKAFAELRKLYEPEEKELAQRRGQRGGEALLRAGLAMMSGTSPHALVNIGKGATEGLNAYQAAQAADDQAARALRQAQITMRMAERQEQIGNRRDAVTLFNQAEQQKQVAASSAQQAEQIKNTRDYQQGSLAVMQQNAASNAKLVQARINALNLPAQQANRKMAEYGKIQQQVMKELAGDVAYRTETDPVKKEQMFRAQMNMAIANNPFLADLLFSGKPTGKVRDLTDDDEED